jgi:alpha-L-glutamate ligase-like protein
MAVSKDILGMNARNFLYIRKYNRPSAKRLADNKLATKRRLIKHTIPTASLLVSFSNRNEVLNFDWNLPKEGFVLKPARGFGGQGILVMRSWDTDKGISISGKEYTIKQLQSHLFDILDGAYSLQYLPDQAFIEELITPHPFFKKLALIGLPDIRVVVFNQVPVMSYMRLPTRESEGKANQNSGALGVGIDLRTGITTYATAHKTHFITYLPGTKTKISGIKIPQWDEILLLAVKTQMATRLGYAGVDIVFDAKKGPMILEVNSRPGLSIQIANKASLRTRLERVEDMKIVTPERGVELAKNLFAEDFSEKVSEQEKTLTVIEPITIKFQGQTKTLLAKLDTGAYRSSIDSVLVKELNLPKTSKKVYVKSASGQHYRPTVTVSFTLAGKKVNTVASVVDRSHLKYQMIIGRLDLKGFTINPIITQGEEEDVLEDVEQ